MEVSRTGRDNIRDTLTDFFLSRIRIMSIWVERVDFTGKRIRTGGFVGELECFEDASERLIDGEGTEGLP